MNKFFTYNIKKPQSLPIAGFKIHVSATPYNFKNILDIVLPYLDKSEINYKYISKKENILKNFSVFEKAPSSGKLITIYPDNISQFKEILKTLYKIIPISTDGIYILSDHPYRNSNNIFYRYGFFKNIPKYTKNGIPTLIGPKGKIWQDYQKCYFDLPSWIDDIQNIKLKKESYLSNNYHIVKIIHSSNGGNIYKGVSKKTTQSIIMKEAKPYILFFNNVEKRTLRQNEYQISQKIHKYTPKPIEAVKEWINNYYIYEYIDGTSLTSYSTSTTLFSYKVTKEEENIKKFKCFLNIIYKVLDLVDYFHKQNIVLNDIHSDNFIIDSNNNIYFVDLETSYEYKKNKPIVGIYNNNSLKSWNNIDGKVADCHKIGNMILFLIGRLQIKSESISELKNNLKLSTNLLQFYGIKSNINKLINYLFTSTATIKTAKRICQQIFVDIKHNNQLFFKDKLKSFKKQSTSFNLLTSNIPIIKKIYLSNKTYKKYLNHLDNPDYIKYFIDIETNMGLDGLAGNLILLNTFSYDKNIILYGVNKLISSIIDTSNGKMIKINDHTASPYLYNGSAGVIKALLNINSKKYKKIIKNLSNGIVTNFAQRPNYWNGMLGIADTLLDSYSLIHDDTYIKFATNLIISSSYYLDSKKLSMNEFIPVFNHLDFLLK